MTSSGTSSLLVLLTAAAAGLFLLASGASAQPSTGSCTQSFLSLLPCLSYISANSSFPSPSPSSQCCSQLSTVVKTDMKCLCSVLSSGAAAMPILRNITINQTQATGLPGACNIQTPQISQCNSITAASSGPAIPPSRTTVPSPPPPSISLPPTAGNGSKVTPQTEDSSDGSLNRLSLTVFFVFLLSALGSTHFL